MISGQFHPDVKDYLIDLKKNYTISEIEELLKLKSGYSHRLFWYLKSYENLKSRYRREPLEEFKKIMLGENPDASYQNSDFRRFVLEPAFKETAKSKAFTDNQGNPTISYELERKGRVVTHIKFNFSRPSQLNLFEQKDFEDQSPLLNQPESSNCSEFPEKLRRPYERLLQYGLTIP